MRELRRDLECLATRFETKGKPPMEISTSELARELEELIAALDRRLPNLELARETPIAQDAARLRARAVQRLAELNTARSRV